EVWDDWAGPISLAVGGAYRSESAVSFSDPLTETKGFVYGNNADFNGAVNVYEGYAETVIPLAKDEWWSKSMDFNAAGRVTDYSTSGVVETWKLGLTSQVDENIRLRTTWSTDIRAPNIYELFTPPQYNRGTQIDPKTGKNVGAYSANSGNPNLVPEVATTISGGVVLTPQFIPGLSMSFDWYSIVVKGAVFQANAQQTINQCGLGVQLYCG